MKKLFALIIVPLGWAAVVAGAINIGPASARTQIVIIAGNGLPGLRDGRSADAEFLLPTALWLAPNGLLFITDGAAQRVRVLDRRTGVVSTIAGAGSINASGLWVDGGYLDGPAFTARFNEPSGVAELPNGDVVVADTYNHCIRLISHGLVSTIAGNATEPGTADGPGGSARFEYPRQMTLGADGDIYVADVGVGIRRIDKQFVVTTLAEKLPRYVTSVSYESTTGAPALLVASTEGISRILLRTGKMFTYPANSANVEAAMHVQGGVPVGSPYSIAAVGGNDAIVTDLRSNAVRYLYDVDAPFVQDLVYTPLETAPIGQYPVGAPYRFFGPMAVQAEGPQSFIVADSGHRRILELRDTSLERGLAFGGDLGALSYRPGVYRIAIVGNSYTWHSTNRQDSIAQVVESELNASGDIRKHHLRVKVVYFNRYVTNYVDLLSTGLADYVVSFINSGNIAGFSNDPLAATGDSGGWQSGLRTSLKQDLVTLRGGHVGMLIVVNPFPWELSPTQGLFRTQNVQEFTFTPPGFVIHSDFSTAEVNLTRTARGLGAPVLDLWPAFRRYDATPDALPLFDTDDWHFALQGRKVAGRAIAEDLLQIRPWETP